MTVFGYARVSTDGQTLASQDAQLHGAGCAKVYSEKISGACSDRPELAAPAQVSYWHEAADDGWAEHVRSAQVLGTRAGIVPDRRL
jgi:hypothetical protein